MNKLKPNINTNYSSRTRKECYLDNLEKYLEYSKQYSQEGIKKKKIKRRKNTTKRIKKRY